jgi:hypothetical protein
MADGRELFEYSHRAVHFPGIAQASCAPVSLQKRLPSSNNNGKSALWPVAVTEGEVCEGAQAHLL